MLLWLYLTCFAVLLGAEINSATELQTHEDTTTGEPQPKGQRRATASDAYPEELPGTPEHDATRKQESPSDDSSADAGPRVQDVGRVHATRPDAEAARQR